MEGHFWHSNLLAVCGASAKTEQAHSREEEVDVAIDGAVVEGGDRLVLGRRAGKEGKLESGGFAGSSDFVFAFRWRKIVVRRGTGGRWSGMLSIRLARYMVMG